MLFLCVLGVAPSGCMGWVLIYPRRCLGLWSFAPSGRFHLMAFIVMGVLIWDVSSLMMHGVCPERRRRGGNIAVGVTHGKCQPIDSNRRAVGR